MATVNGTIFDLQNPTLVRKVINDIIVSCYSFGDRGTRKHVARYDIFISCFRGFISVDFMNEFDFYQLYMNDNLVGKFYP